MSSPPAPNFTTGQQEPEDCRQHQSATDAGETAVGGAGEGVRRAGGRDDGRGGAEVTRGSGLVGLTDRVETLGGRISLCSPPGAGTDPEIALPLDDPSGPGLPPQSPAIR